MPHFRGVACPCTLDYRDGNFPERAGWKEVVATAGPGLTLLIEHRSGRFAQSGTGELPHRSD